MALRDLHVSPRRVLPARLLTFRSVRSGGPGGQNVNKVATQVILSLDLDGAEVVLGEDNVRRVRSRLANRLDADGRLTVRCGSTRSRARNLEIAHRRLEEWIGSALARPRTRRATRPTAASQRRRVETKRRRSATKASRRPPGED